MSAREPQSESAAWEKAMRRRFRTRSQVMLEARITQAQLDRLRMAGEIGYVTLGWENSKSGVRRLLRYADYCDEHDWLKWCEHNGGCSCEGGLTPMHAPHQ